jgi:VWFA-related protein
MRKFVVTAGLILLGLSLTGQELKHDSVVVNIEIPVRVFKGDKFIDNLSIDNFELYEDGVLQKIEAFYLIGKTKIERSEASMEKDEARKKFAPSVSRHFVLVFEVLDYNPKFKEILDDFFTKVIAPGDSLIVITPMKTYKLNSHALEEMNLQTIAVQLKSILRKDVILGNTTYNNLVKEIIKALLNDSGTEINFAFSIQYLENLYAQWYNLKHLQEKNLINFANYLKGLDGQKHVFLFYQKETLPQLSDRRMVSSFSDAQRKPHYYQKMYDLFLFYRRDINFDVNKIKEAFSDSSISSHFLYLTQTRSYTSDMDIKTPAEDLIQMQEKSEDIFSAFKQVAKATGGITESSANPTYMFKKAVDTSENYYLLYYTPKNYTADGKFRNVKVKIKGGNYRVLHRAGYIAD